MIQVLRETKEAPADVQERVARAGGRNFYGQPNFRIVWGRNIHAGEANFRYPFAAPDRWYLQRWLAPEVCGAAGGDYEICDDSGLLGSGIPAVGTLENFLIPLIERSRGISFLERRAAIQAREEREERRFESRAYNILDDAAPAFHGVAHSGPAGPVKSFLEKAEEKWAASAKAATAEQ
jgi:hypothetical protein